MALVHKASRNKIANRAQTNMAAADSSERPHTPLIVEVTTKMIDHPFMFASPVYLPNRADRVPLRTNAEFVAMRAPCHCTRLLQAQGHTQSVEKMRSRSQKSRVGVKIFRFAAFFAGKWSRRP
jgi:hypothetical protein